jgi:hypothetical protein
MVTNKPEYLGYFDLCPSRVFDISIDKFNPQPLLDRESMLKLLMKKYSWHQKTFNRLSISACLLIKAGNVDLDEIWTRLEPSDDEIQTEMSNRYGYNDRFERLEFGDEQYNLYKKITEPYVNHKSRIIYGLIKVNKWDMAAAKIEALNFDINLDDRIVEASIDLLEWAIDESVQTPLFDNGDI